MRRAKTGSLAAVLCSVAIGLPVVFVLLLTGEGSCGLGGDAPAPSAAAENGIPGNYLALYRAAGERYAMAWTLLAAIGSVETDHGRSQAAGVRSGVNFAGCCAGPMQFLITGAGGGTWGAYGVDGDGDGDRDVYDPRDAVPAAATYLTASGAPGDLHRAIFAYNHSEAYVQQVLAKMREYAAGAEPAAATGSDPGIPAGSCEDLGGLTGSGDGRFEIAAGANAPGRPLSAAMTAFVARMATFYDGTIIVSTGTSHSRLTTSGNVSDHFSGNGVDLGMAANGGTNRGPVGDRLAAAAFLAAGLPRDEAIVRARAGGAQTVVSNGLRIQVIWKSQVGGDHDDHVHVGIGPTR